MAKINIRAKGQNGERELAKWLQMNFNLEHCPQRCLEQVRFGQNTSILNQQGYDLIGFEPFAVEVKRQESLVKRTWWRQCKIAADRCSTEKIPVVAYRQNRKKWKFLIGAKWIGLEVGFIQLEAKEFIAWAQAHLEGN